MTLLLSHVGISIGFHRFFSHRSFQTSGLGKWVLATVGTLTLQGTPLYWAAQHRLHHIHCEEPADPHSPSHGFLHAHGGWLTGLTGPTIDSHPEWSARLVRDLALDPDLGPLMSSPWSVVHPLAVALGLPVVSLLAFGGHATLWYLHAPQVLAWHATMSVNSATHTFGYARRVNGACHARNVPWLFGILLGESWHANHHFAPQLTSMEGAWWEIDPQFRLLEIAEMLGLVWDLRAPLPVDRDYSGSVTFLLLQMAFIPLGCGLCCLSRAAGVTIFWGHTFKKTI